MTVAGQQSPGEPVEPDEPVEPRDPAEPDEPAALGGPAEPPRPLKRRRRRRRIFIWTSAALAVIVAGGVLTAYVKYRSISDSIHRVTITDLGPRPKVYSTTSMNILVFGSDSRAGLDHHQQVLLHTGDDQGNNTDTIMVVHLSPGRHLVTVLSIPRDTMVPYYQCDAGSGYPGQQATPGATERINALLAAGGPSCLWKTVEQQTGIPINHFIEIGLAGFVNVINDLDGVNVCAPFNVDDPVSGLRLDAGEHHIDGVTALDFWRTREDIGEGSDQQRIQRDQFMSAQVVKGIVGSRLLSDPVRLLRVLSDAAPNLTTDRGMSLSNLLEIGQSLRNIPSKDVQFVTAPNEPDPANPTATVQFAQPQANEVFSAIARDITIPRSGGAARQAKHPVTGTTASASASPAVPPAQVQVRVLNGSGIGGVAAIAAGQLSARGFDVTGTGNAPAFGYTSSVIEYPSPAALAAVDTLKRQLRSVKAELDPGLPAGALVLVLGADFTSLAPLPPQAPNTPSTATTTSPASPSPSPAGVGSLAQHNGGIDAAASCGSDASAFNGPLSP